MVKTRRKITALRILQVLFYALGFPLFVHLVILASSSYRDSNFVAGEILTSPVFYAAVLWAIVVCTVATSRGKRSVMRKFL